MLVKQKSAGKEANCVGSFGKPYRMYEAWATSWKVKAEIASHLECFLWWEEEESKSVARYFCSDSLVCFAGEM